MAGACMAGQTATAADSTHPTGMHSCLAKICRKLHEIEENWTQGGSAPPKLMFVIISVIFFVFTSTFVPCEHTLSIINRHVEKQNKLHLNVFHESLFHTKRDLFLVADPGFPGGGVADKLFDKILAENCMKTKEIGPRGRRNPSPPPGCATDFCLRQVYGLVHMYRNIFGYWS